MFAECAPHKGRAIGTVDHQIIPNLIAVDATKVSPTSMIC